MPSPSGGRFTVQQVLLKRGLGGATLEHCRGPHRVHLPAVTSISIGGEPVPRPEWTNTPLTEGGSNWLVTNYSFEDLDAQDEGQR